MAYFTCLQTFPPVYTVLEKEEILLTMICERNVDRLTENDLDGTYFIPITLLKDVYIDSKKLKTTPTYK